MAKKVVKKVAAKKAVVKVVKKVVAKNAIAKKVTPAKKSTPIKKVAKKVIAKTIAKPAPKKAVKVIAKKALPVKVAKKTTKVIAKKVLPGKVAKKATKVIAKASNKKVVKPIAKKTVSVKTVKKASKVIAKATNKKVVKPIVKKATKVIAKASNKKVVKPTAKKAIVKPIVKAAKVLKSKEVKIVAKIIKPTLKQIASEKKPVIANKPYVPKEVHKKAVLVSKTRAEKKQELENNAPAPYRFEAKALEMATEAKRYSDVDLAEFKEIIILKMTSAKSELANLLDQMQNPNANGGNDTDSSYQTLEDGQSSSEKEQLSQLAARQRKFIENLDNALSRIQNKTYGICKVTGKLIAKERLRAVPHTTLSMEAKLQQYK